MVFQRGCGSEGLPRGESGCNLLSWNRWYINQFYGQFPFREVGAGDEEALDAYFKSDHFLKALQFPVMPTTNHIHINVHASVHADAVQKHAEDALRREGWEIYYVCPNVYLVGGQYRGKLVFMGKKPEVVFDIGWAFTSEAVIEPAWETWIFEANPGYDLWTSDMLAEVMNEKYVRLSDDEIQGVLDACFFPKQGSR